MVKQRPSKASSANDIGTMLLLAVLLSLAAVAHGGGGGGGRSRNVRAPLDASPGLRGIVAPLGEDARPIPFPKRRELQYPDYEEEGLPSFPPSEESSEEKLAEAVGYLAETMEGLDVAEAAEALEEAAEKFEEGPDGGMYPGGTYPGTFNYTSEPPYAGEYNYTGAPPPGGYPLPPGEGVMYGPPGYEGGNRTDGYGEGEGEGDFGFDGSVEGMPAEFEPGLSANPSYSPSSDGSGEVEDGYAPLEGFDEEGGPTFSPAPTTLLTYGDSDVEGWGGDDDDKVEKEWWPEEQEEPRWGYPTESPSPRPTVKYVSNEGSDPLLSEEEADTKDFPDDVPYHGWGGAVGSFLDGVESPQELERDRNVQVVAGTVVGVFMVLLLVTAHLVMQYPDGLCAGCCRLTLKCVCCFARTLCLPCRAVCCKGGERAQGRRTHAPMRTPFPTDLELA